MSSTLFFDLKKADSSGQTGSVAVHWEVLTPKGQQQIKYRATITSSLATEVILSLYNIGAQGRRVAGEITKATVAHGHTVAISDEKNAPSDPLKFTAFTRPVRINRAKNAQDVSETLPAPPDEHKVRFLKFSGGLCTLEITSDRTIHSPMTRESHESTPPPPQPGGQDGTN